MLRKTETETPEGERGTSAAAADWSGGEGDEGATVAAGEAPGEPALLLLLVLFCAAADAAAANGDFACNIKEKVRPRL